MRELTTSDYWYSWEWHINDENREELQAEATRRVERAILELGAAEEVLACIRTKWTWGTLRNAGVKHGERVIVEYRDGPVEAVFEGVEKRLINQIVLRHLTKKGTPEKQPHRTSYTMATHIKPKAVPKTGTNSE